MYSVAFKPSFIRDLKKYQRQGGDIEHVHAIIDLLRTGNPLPASLSDHQLTGKLRQYRDLHVEHDRILIYEKDGTSLRIICLKLVTHQKMREWERSL